jgi:CheY-like chemotaxis protein
VSQILVADDIALNLFAIKGVFKHLNVKIDTCHNGREVIDKVLEKKKKQNQSYSVILMDIEMPILDGRSVKEESILFF